MPQKKEKTVGIIGGMGPEATVDLMQRIIRLTPALDDIDHIRCIVDNNPKIPSRIKAIIKGANKNSGGNPGEDPAPCLADMARRLETWGADFLAIACNTAHHYYDAIDDAVDIPVVHIIDEVLDHIKIQFPNCKSIGILASPAIRITKIYEEKFHKAGITIIYPDPDEQDCLFAVIRQVKAGKLEDYVRNDYLQVCTHLQNKKARLAIVACTELSALNINCSLPLIDAAHILARTIVNIAKGETN